MVIITFNGANEGCSCCCMNLQPLKLAVISVAGHKKTHAHKYIHIFCKKLKRTVEGEFNLCAIMTTL